MYYRNVPRRGLLWTLSFSVLLTPLFTPELALAQSVPLPASINHGASGASASASGSVSNHAMNLDLSSTQATISSHNSSPVQIQVGGSLNQGSVTGGSSLLVNPGQLLTPAQNAAVFEVLKGNQTLLLGAQGNALGGALNLSSSFAHNIGSLVVPQNV